MTYKTTNVKGVDVDYPYQGDAYNTTGLGFVFVKATQGNHWVNPHLTQQVNQGVTHGLVTGRYLFMEAGLSAKSQAEFFHQHAMVFTGTPIAIDWEGFQGRWPTNDEKNKLIKAVKQLFPKNKVGLYTNVDGWTHHDSDSYCGDFLWIAEPGKPGDVSIKHNWTFHQYAVLHNVDQNTSMFENIRALKEWAGIPVAESKDYRDQEGFGTWSYKNPMGQDDPDAWQMLNELHAGVQALEGQVTKLSTALAAVSKLLEGKK
jgi:Glycosyl hydrolases family 25